jgi:hypothetical protein
MKLINASTDPSPGSISDKLRSPCFFNVEQSAQRRLLLIDEEGVAAEGAAVRERRRGAPAAWRSCFDQGAHVYFVGDID